jgi:hypothetical protein
MLILSIKWKDRAVNVRGMKNNEEGGKMRVLFGDPMGLF